MKEVELGCMVEVHYVGTLSDGTEFDNSYKRSQPATFQLGNGSVIPGFESAIVGMSEGENKDIVLKCADAYGERNEELFQEFPLTIFDPSIEVTVGMQVRGETGGAEAYDAFVSSVDENAGTATLDFNHPLAGKDLNFSVEVVKIHSNTAPE